MASENPQSEVESSRKANMEGSNPLPPNPNVSQAKKNTNIGRKQCLGFGIISLLYLIKIPMLNVGCYVTIVLILMHVTLNKMAQPHCPTI